MFYNFQLPKPWWISDSGKWPSEILKEGPPFPRWLSNKSSQILRNLISSNEKAFLECSLVSSYQGPIELTIDEFFNLFILEITRANFRWLPTSFSISKCLRTFFNSLEGRAFIRIYEKLLIKIECYSKCNKITSIKKLFAKFFIRFH